MAKGTNLNVETIIKKFDPLSVLNPKLYKTVFDYIVLVYVPI